MELGADLNAFAFKTLHLETAEKMKYSLEQIMQSQFMVFYTSMIQIALAFSFYVSYAMLPNFGVT